MNPSARKLLAALLAAAAHGCGGYADGSTRPAIETPLDPPPFIERPPATKPPAPPEQPQRDAAADLPADPPPLEPEQQPEDWDAGAEDDPTNLQLVRSAQIDGYLADAAGQALYMFVDDVAGVAESACLGECARAWPPFDVPAAVTRGLDPADISRFHRQDGLWQTKYKGHALYYYAAEGGRLSVSGDGHAGRWFVARDYLAFLGAARVFAPTGGGATNTAYLTDGFGRTLYVCLDDQPRTALSAAISSCDAACTAQRPVFAVSESARTTLLPSAIEPAELGELERPDGQVQITYRGWPLYYCRGDGDAGSTEGHNDRAWRAIDPLTFGLQPAPGTEY
jgi:predicted lipoprotein with Yx(FWY)xxD motif